MDVFGDGEPAVFVHGSFGWGIDSFSEQVAPAAVRSLVAIDPTLFDHAPDSHAAREMALALGAVYRSAPEMDIQAFVDAWGTAWGRSPEAQRAWVEGLGENDWAAAEATRRERYPGDAPVDFDILASATFPKVVVSGAWPTDIAPGRERARDALNDVADAVATRIGAARAVFPRSTHGPQWEEPQDFNGFLRRVWTSARPPR